MKKILLAVIAFFATFFTTLFNHKPKKVTVHGMRVNKKSREAKILASTHTIEAPRYSSLQLFTIGAQQVWALNLKNALRKAKLYPNQELIGG